MVRVFTYVSSCFDLFRLDYSIANKSNHIRTNSPSIPKNSNPHELIYMAANPAASELAYPQAYTTRFT